MACCACEVQVNLADDPQDPTFAKLEAKMKGSETVLRVDPVREEKLVDVQMSETSTNPLPFMSQELDASRYRCSTQEMSQSASIDMAVVSQRITKTDTEILRGVRLRDTLKGFGRLWRCNPMKLKPESRTALFKLSRPVPSLDVFLSHTWSSKGWAKVLSLLLQSGCNTALVFWLCGASFAVLLTFADALPLPFVYSANMSYFKEMCPVGPWVMLFGFLGTLLGLLVSPYFAGRCHGGDMCFVDAACIHQTNQALMQRGINGIGGFLLVSKELRILWSQPYLSRLWCVFELATYKKMNPEGAIVMAPLFVDESVLLKYLGILLCTATYWTIRANSGRTGYNIVLPGTLVCSLPLLITIHFDRRNYLMKHQLFSQFQNFNLDATECSNAADRDFVYAAISHLYGSKEAFTEYVRGPLQLELLEPVCQNKLPLRYTKLLVTPFLSLFLDFSLAIWKQGATWEDLAIYTVSMFGLATTLHIPAVLTMVTLLSDRFAEPTERLGKGAAARRVMDYLQSFMVFAAIVVHSAAGFVVCFAVASVHNWWFLLGCFFLFLAILVLTKKLRDKLQVQQKRLQKARSLQIDVSEMN